MEQETTVVEVKKQEKLNVSQQKLILIKASILKKEYDYVMNN